MSGAHSLTNHCVGYGSKIICTGLLTGDGDCFQSKHSLYLQTFMKILIGGGDM